MNDKCEHKIIHNSTEKCDVCNHHIESFYCPICKPQPPTKTAAGWRVGKVHYTTEHFWCVQIVGIGPLRVDGSETINSLIGFESKELTTQTAERIVAAVTWYGSEAGFYGRMAAKLSQDKKQLQKENAALRALEKLRDWAFKYEGLIWEHLNYWSSEPQEELSKIIKSLKQ